MTRREKDKAIYLIKSLIGIYVPYSAIEYSSLLNNATGETQKLKTLIFEVLESLGDKEEEQ
jgi:hypothetical protein